MKMQLPCNRFSLFLVVVGATVLASFVASTYLSRVFGSNYLGRPDTFGRMLVVNLLILLKVLCVYS
jgi:hypothetical protein